MPKFGSHAAHGFEQVEPSTAFIDFDESVIVY